MKKTKRFFAVVLCMLLMLTPLAVVAETVTVQAAGPQTVKVKLDKKTGFPLLFRKKRSCLSG